MDNAHGELRNTNTAQGPARQMD
eukprot:SAG31_NODE_25380_length_462_cov_1.085399_1_plen_22_part_10